VPRREIVRRFSHHIVTQERHMDHFRRLTSLAPTLVLAMLAACADSPTGPPRGLSDAVTARQASNSETGGVYTMTNGAGANAVIAFRRGADGSLSPLGTSPTGGRGTGGAIDPLMSQYALALDDGHRTLFVVNAGSDQVSAFRVRDDATLELADVASSGGDMPVSLASRGAFLYVLNAGSNTISGLRVNPNGKLIPIAHSTRSLAPGAAGASTIHFSADGDRLIVTERDANRIETFAVDANGRLGDPVVTPSNGAVPFGFDVTPRGHPIITEAMGAAPNGAISSYRVNASGALTVITRSLNAGGMATCWLILTSDGHIAFVSNTLSNTIGAFRVADDGTVTVLNTQAGSTGPGSAPIDVDLVGDRYLYVLEGGTGAIATFDVAGTGALSPRPDTPAGPPASGLQGVAAW
jgi:6-phosphogluconolactonase